MLEQRRGRLTVRFDGEVDLATLQPFASALDIGLTSAAGHLDVDVCDLTFIDCRGADALAAAARRASAEATQLRLIPGAALDAILRSFGGWADLSDVLERRPEEQGGAEVARRTDAFHVAISEPRAHTVVVRPVGDLELATADLFARIVRSAAVSRSVIVDLAGLGSLTTRGARVLLQTDVVDGAAAIRLAGGARAVRRVLRQCGVDDVLEHCGSLVEALAPRRVAAVPRTGQPRGRSRRRESYDHLEPLLAELSQLSPDDARRDALRSELITAFLPVARNIARKYLYRGEHLDDLEQVATLGLINAIDRFDPDRGTDFLAFAVPTISGEVQRHYRDRTARIRIPRPLRDLHVRIQQAVQELSQRHGAAPTPRAVAAHLDVDVETVIEALQAVYETHCSSLDEPVVDDESGSGDASLLQRLGAEDPEIDLVEDRQSLTGPLNDLPERERRILLLRFYGNMTQTEIAKRIGISQMHVSRLLAASLAQLRRRLCTDG